MNYENKQTVLKNGKKIAYDCNYHVIFATKYLRKVLSEEVKGDLFQIIKEKEDSNNIKVLDFLCSENYVHLLVSVNPRFGILKFVNLVKSDSSGRLREKYTFLRSRLPTLWNGQCLINSVGIFSEQKVVEFLSSQKKA